MPGILEDGTYIAFPQVVFTHAGVPDEVVYQMAKAMSEQAKVMGGPSADARFPPSRYEGGSGGRKFHPGALKFFKEAGLN